MVPVVEEWVLVRSKHKGAYLCSVVSNSLHPCGLYSASLLRLWDFPARILEWVSISSSRGHSPPRDQTLISHVSCIFADGFPTAEPVGKPTEETSREQ